MAGTATRTTDSDDAPIDLRAYCHTVRECTEITGAPPYAMYMWRDRNQLNVSDHCRYRVRYSVLDMVAITVMHRLTYRCRLTPAEAAPIAHLAAEMAGQFTRGPDGKLLGSPLGNNIMVAFDPATGGVLVGVATLGAPGHYVPPSFEDAANSALREPHICIPIASIRRDVIERVYEMLSREESDD